MPISRIYTLHKNLERETYKPLQDTKLAPQNGDICTVLEIPGCRIPNFTQFIQGLFSSQ